MKSRMTWCLATLLALSAVSASQAQSPGTVLVVANANNPQSVALANYYMNRRGIPASNKLLLAWDASDNADTCTLAHYNANIAAPVYAKIATLAAIDYIVLCRNLPIKISDTSGSVDSALAGKSTTKRSNPYAGRTNAFTSAAYGVYLVTRLDGWSWGDAVGLVNRGLAKAKPTAPFVLDKDPAKDAGSDTLTYNMLFDSANTKLIALGKPTLLNTSSTFLDPAVAIAGYISWGSNDANFSITAYNNLTFAPGAIAETLVSTSASNLRYPGGWQSQIALLIRNGITGVKGYVAEPFTSATARPQILFPRYAGGANLASSFYASSPYMGWKDVIVGDPLCAPYAP